VFGIAISVVSHKCDESPQNDSTISAPRSKRWRRVPPRCGIIVIPSCAPSSISGRASACDQIASEASVSRKHKRSLKHPYYLDQRIDLPEQYRAIGWVGHRLFSFVFELRHDDAGEYYHLVTLWRATKEEENLYEE